MHPTPAAPAAAPLDTKKPVQPDAKEEKSDATDQKMPELEDPSSSHLTCLMVCGMGLRACCGIFDFCLENFSQGDNFSATNTRRRACRRMSGRDLEVPVDMPEFDINMLTEEQRRRLQKSFRLFDIDGTGVIKDEELTKMMQLMGHNPTRGDIMDILEEIDTDKSGTVDFSEFAQAWWITEKIHMQRDMDEELRLAFAIFKKDDEDNLHIEELREILTKVGDPLSDQEVKDLFEEADTNKDGQISFAEFRNMKCWRGGGV